MLVVETMEALILYVLGSNLSFSADMFLTRTARENRGPFTVLVTMGPAWVIAM